MDVCAVRVRMKTIPKLRLNATLVTPLPETRHKANTGGGGG